MNLKTDTPKSSQEIAAELSSDFSKATMHHDVSVISYHPTEVLASSGECSSVLSIMWLFRNDAIICKQTVFTDNSFVSVPDLMWSYLLYVFDKEVNLVPTLWTAEPFKDAPFIISPVNLWNVPNRFLFVFFASVPTYLKHDADTKLSTFTQNTNIPLWKCDL